MASLTLHDIPEELLEQLESRAQANSRSLEAEVLLVLESIVVPKATSPFGARLRAFISQPQHAQDLEGEAFEVVRAQDEGRESPW